MIECFSSCASLTQFLTGTGCFLLKCQGGAVWEKPAGIDSWHEKFYPRPELWQEQTENGALPRNNGSGTLTNQFWSHLETKNIKKNPLSSDSS